MSATLAEFNRLTDTEQYLEFFNLAYNQHFVNVNRLHILRFFSQSIAEINAESPELSDSGKLAQYEQALQKAYNLFLSSSPLEQKLFKVFNDQPPNVVLLAEIGAETGA